MAASLSFHNMIKTPCSFLRRHGYNNHSSLVSASPAQHHVLDLKKHGQNVLWRSNPKPTSSAVKCGRQLEGEKLMMKKENKNDPEVEIEEEEEEENWEEIERWDGKCEGREGVVELLECLEREAIMGDDEGIDPTDYNRRAHIFDKSSRVFQALKAKQTSS